MPVSNFHKNAQRVFYPTFDGGLNLAVPPESLAKNELKVATNVEFSPSTGAMTVRGGLVWYGRFSYANDSILPVTGKQAFLVRRKGKEDAVTKKYTPTKTLQYYKWNYIWPVSGSLTGTGELSIVQWGDCHLIASGGKLQKFTDSETPKLETIEYSPAKCRYVFVRDGRVGVIDGDDTLRFSAVGDCESETSWTNVADQPSSSQYIRVGYKDGMTVDAIVPLSRDLIVFKSPNGESDKGTIYRLIGSYPDWSVVAVAHNTGTFSQRSVQAVANDVYYITIAGIASLSSVSSYGDIKAQWPDRKVSSALTQLLTNTAELWNVPVKQQLWVLPKKDAKQIWVFDYSRGIWTTFEFPKAIVHAVGVDNSLFVFIDKDLYKVVDGYTVDELRGKNDADGNPTFSKKQIKAKMQLGTLLTGMQMLVKGVFASFSLLPLCKAVLKIGKFQMVFSGGTPEYINGYNNDGSTDLATMTPSKAEGKNAIDIAYSDNDSLFSQSGVLTSRRQCIVRDWAITPEVEITGGGCALSTIGLETAEV